MRLLMIISCVVSAQSFVLDEYLQQWLIRTQYVCLKVNYDNEDTNSNYIDTHSKYSNCIHRVTVTEVKPPEKNHVVTLKSYCAKVLGSGFKFKQTQWQIQGLRAVKMSFSDFLLTSTCNREYLVVQGENNSLMFCGKRKPWMRDVIGIDIKLKLFLTNVKTEHNYFTIQYHLISNIQQRHIELKLKSGVKKGITLFLEIPLKYSLHIFIDSFFDRVQLVLASSCPEVDATCHDGPGSLAPKLIRFSRKKLSLFILI